MDVIELCRQLIRNACVNDGTAASGHEHRSVETLADYFGHAGEIFEPAPGRQSMVYRLSGRDPDAPSLLLMGHTDVVPVSEEGWSRDPFGAEIHDGFIWGRGAVDMLNQTAAMAAAFRPYLLGDLQPPAGDLIFLAVADEEAAGSLGAQPLVDNHWDRVSASYVMTEIAYPAVELGGGRGYPIAVGEKGPFWSKLRSGGTPGHGSVPYGTDNALAPMVDGLSRLFDSEMPVEISPVWRDFVGSLDVPPALAAALLDPEQIDAAVESIAQEDPRMAAYVHACTHMTVSVNVLKGGVKSNMVPDRAVAQVDVRALPGQRREDVDLHLRKAMGAAADRIDIEPVADFEANASPTGSSLWEVIVDSIEDQTGSRRVVPTMMPATTDARFFRAKGSVAYGVGLFDDRVSFQDFLTMFHGNDERISIESLERTTTLMEGILERWAERD